MAKTKDLELEVLKKNPKIPSPKNGFADNMKKPIKDVSEAVVVIWMPMLRTLPEHDHKCPCYPEEHGLCPCSPFIEKLECKCGLFIVKETYRYEQGEENPTKVKRVKVHG